MIRPPYNDAPANRITIRIVNLRDLLLILSEDSKRAQRKERTITHAKAVRNRVTDNASAIKAARSPIL